MSWFVVDCEADGPIPHLYSMVSFGVVKVDEGLQTTFYGQTKPISDLWEPEALAISGFTREQHLRFDDPKSTMEKFYQWIIKHNSNGRPIFMSDNLAFDWQWINYYFYRFIGKNPFGFSGRRIADIICGLEKDLRFQWKHLRKTPHSHFAVDDAKGNAEAFLLMCKNHRLRL